MSTSVHHVLWTGGWDSTFRVLDLAIMHGRVVQPWYVLEPGRSTTQRELDTMERIRRALTLRDPRAGSLVQPTVIRTLDQIPPDPAHAASAEIAGAREPITTQQHFLPVLVRHEGLGAMETGITADDHMEDAFARSRVVRSDEPAPDDWWYLDESASDPDDFRVWGSYRLPVLHLRKLPMASYADRHGFRDLLEVSWFCRQPTLLGNPCGLCVPCDVTREAGVLWRVPELTPTRRFLFRTKGRIRQRADVLQANWTSVSRRLPGRG